jgi:hypothetical protein
MIHAPCVHRYCKPCLAQNPKRTITVRGPTRKSTRTKKAPDYGILSDEGNAGRWQLLMQGKTIAKDSFRRMPGGELTLEWLEADPDSLKNPIIVETPDGLGMKMPPTDFSVDDVAEAVGENTPVEVIGSCAAPSCCSRPHARVDVATQSNCPGWTLGKWAEYYGTPAAERDKIRNVIRSGYLIMSAAGAAERMNRGQLGDFGNTPGRPSPPSPYRPRAGLGGEILAEHEARPWAFVSEGATVLPDGV